MNTPINPAGISPAPSDDEVVAIAAALQAMWPVPVVSEEPAPQRSTAWKFSGRWWNRPVPSRRDRPYR